MRTTLLPLRGSNICQDVYEAGYLNADFGSTSFDDALRMVGTGEGSQYPMLTFAITTIVDLYPTVPKRSGSSRSGEGANGLTCGCRRRSTG